MARQSRAGQDSSFNPSGEASKEGRGNPIGHFQNAFRNAESEGFCKTPSSSRPDGEAVAGDVLDPRIDLPLALRLDTGVYPVPSCNEIGRCLALLEEGYRQRATDMLWLTEDPAYDFLNAVPQYQSILKRVDEPPAK